MTALETQLLQRLKILPPERVAEVVDFVEFLASRVQRAAAAQRLTDAMARLDALNLPALSEDEIEDEVQAARLQRRGLAVWSWHNAFLRGLLMSAVLVAAAWAMGGIAAALFFCACALWGKALLEIVNYMEHYGMVRDPAQPVQPRHSWNTNRRISSWALFNLTRHSHHHAQGEVPYQDLQPYPNAPMMVGGYLTTICSATR